MATEIIESLSQKAREAIAQGKIEQARALYQQALGLKADSPDVHYGLATVCFMLHDLDSAAYHFKEVTRLDPLRPGAYVNLGAVYNRLEEYDEAINVLRRGIQLDPRRAEGYYNLGLAYRKKGQAALAIHAYLEATKINNMVDAHYNLANIYLEMGKNNLAITHYKQALKTRPNWDKALHGLSQAEAARFAIDHPEGEAPEPEKVTASGDDKAGRSVDPNFHGPMLSVLHAATIESENHSRELLEILEQQIEPAIKELSTCLLTPNSAGTNLSECIMKFEDAVTSMRTIRREMQTTIDRVKNIGERLLRT